MLSPSADVASPNTAAPRPLFGRPFYSDFLVWCAVVFVGANVAFTLEDDADHPAGFYAGKVLGLFAMVAGAALLRRWLRPRLGRRARTTLKVLAAVLAVVLTFGVIAGYVCARGGSDGREALTEAQVQLIAGHIRNGTDPDDEAQREFAHRRVTPDQAQRLAAAAGDSPMAQDLEGLNVADRNEYFLGLLAENLPGRFTQDESALAAAWHVCMEVPGNPEASFEFVPAAGSGVSASDTGTFTMMAVRVLCSQHMADALLLRR